LWIGSYVIGLSGPRGRFETGTPMTTFDRDFWRRLVDAGLPSRQLAMDRENLLRAIVDRIGRWFALNPNIGPHAERVRQIAAAFDQLQRATEKVGAAFEEIGVKDATEKYQAESEAFTIYTRAVEGLGRWQRLYRPKDSGQDSYGATLVKDLKGYCCGRDADDPEGRGNAQDRGAGIAEHEWDTLLQRIADSGRLPIDLKRYTKGKESSRTGLTRPGVGAARARSR
jgi:hypothetical protein